MPKIRLIAFHMLLCVGLVGLWGQRPAYAADLLDACDRLDIDPEASIPFKEVTLPRPDRSCKPKASHGLPIPDPNCNPGAINPTISLEILETKGFTTDCIRDKATSAGQKEQTYAWYGLKKPRNNSGQSQTCELDHIIPLVLGGSDHLDNLWPQCGPQRVSLNRRFFKQKDLVEVFLSRQVKAGKMDLAEAQRGIAEDWTQFRNEAAKPIKKPTKKPTRRTKKNKRR
jgi:hypothetical protein